MSRSNATSIPSVGFTRRLSHNLFAPVLTILICSFSLAAQDTAGSQTQSPASEVRQTSSVGSIAGTVRDAQGEPVVGATVAVVGQESAYSHVLTADNKGAFAFAELAPDTYRVTVESDGSSQRVISVDVVLGAGERRELPIIGTRVAMSRSTAHVEAKVSDIAEAQLKQEEGQRLLGIVPNFYTSYIWDAAPMNSKQKFMLTLRSNTDPFNFALVATLAALEQKNNTFPGYGQGLQGYGKRLGGAYADTMVSKMMSRAIFSSVFHQDPRYFYRGSGSVRSRVVYALTSAIICRGDNGRLQPNYSQVLGSFAATGISNLYRVGGDRTASLTVRNGLGMIASAAVQNVIREFVSRKLTPNVPGFANGKP